jgi:hypothetical protein
VRTRLPRCLLPFLIAATNPVYARPFSLGIKGGVPLTDFFNSVSTGVPRSFFTSNTNRYIIGPTVELRLPAGLGIELDMLYRHFNYNLSTSVGKDYCCLTYLVTNSHTTGGSWEFPLLLKYRFSTRTIKPYMDAGATFDTLTGLTQTFVSTVVPSQQTSTTTTSHPSELKETTTKGFAIGVGADIHAAVLHIMPEIRYTRWGSGHFAIPELSPLSNRNQAEILVGITF